MQQIYAKQQNNRMNNNAHQSKLINSVKFDNIIPSTILSCLLRYFSNMQLCPNDINDFVWITGFSLCTNETALLDVFHNGTECDLCGILHFKKQTVVILWGFVKRYLMRQAQITSDGNCVEGHGANFKTTMLLLVSPSNLIDAPFSARHSTVQKHWEEPM